MNQIENSKVLTKFLYRNLARQTKLFDKESKYKQFFVTPQELRQKLPKYYLPSFLFNLNFRIFFRQNLVKDINDQNEVNKAISIGFNVLKNLNLARYAYDQSHGVVNSNNNNNNNNNINGNININNNSNSNNNNNNNSNNNNNNNNNINGNNINSNNKSEINNINNNTNNINNNNNNSPDNNNLLDNIKNKLIENSNFGQGVSFTKDIGFTELIKELEFESFEKTFDQTQQGNNNSNGVNNGNRILNNKILANRIGGGNYFGASSKSHNTKNTMIKIGKSKKNSDCWPLNESEEIKPGTILISHPSLRDFFKKKIVLITHVDGERHYGLVINKPISSGPAISYLQLESEENKFNYESSLNLSKNIQRLAKYAQKRPLNSIQNWLFGGPESIKDHHILSTLQGLNGAQILHPYKDIQGAKKIRKGLYIGGNFKDIREKVRKGEIDSKQLMMFVGCTFWSNGQLQKEIDEGAWFKAGCTNQVIFEGKNQNIWADVLRSMGGDYGNLILN